MTIAKSHMCLLPNRAILRLSGSDCESFLQSIITHDVTRLKSEPTLFAAMLSPQGKFQHDFFLQRAADAILLDTEAHLKDALITRLKRYRLRAQVTIDDVSTDYHVVASWGETSALPDLPPDPRLAALGWRGILSQHMLSDTTPEPFDSYDRHRLALGVPDGSRDATERTVIMENGYDMLNAISFSKGCYVGQEVTARMHYRQILRKCLFRVEADSPLPPCDTPITVAGREIGYTRSHCGHIGLALMRLHEWQESDTLLAGDLPVRVTLPDYMRAKLAQITAAQEA